MIEGLLKKTMKLILTFDDRPKDFTHGVEFGMIYQKLVDKKLKEVDNGGFPVRLENQELIYQACIINEYTPHFKECYVSGWVNFIATKNKQ